MKFAGLPFRSAANTPLLGRLARFKRGIFKQMKSNFRTRRKQAIRQGEANKISKRGRKPHPAVEFPKPRSLSWKDPVTFHEALTLHMARHGETAGRLLKAIAGPDDRTDRKTIAQWATGIKTPRTVGLLFGALAASPSSPIAGAGVPRASLAMGMLIFPAVWDWYLQWRERRRGFFTAWEVNMLQLGLALTRIATGWLRQHPELADRLRPIPGLVSQEDVASVKADWAGACDAFYQYGFARANEIRRVARVHRDPFEPILPILEAESPLGEYRLIVQEIIRLMPDADRYPLAAAEAVRSLLMLRLGLHLGVRQKNLRQLLLCFPRHQPTPERQLELRKCGELRWIDRERAWEVLIPAVAFKNAGSSFFAKRPFQVRLPDLDGLYGYIGTYIRRARPVLLGGLADTYTFFVKTMKRTSKDAAYDQNTFYEAWRLIIQRYGIYNPYTGRGAINGLLPHGPHSVRDVLATHILKQTGSYEQASYAIQDTPEVVAKYYARFLPQDKAALAAQVLNQVWEAA